MTDTDNIIYSGIKCTNWCNKTETLNCVRLVVFYNFLIERYISFICNERVPFVPTPRRLLPSLKGRADCRFSSWSLKLNCRESGRAKRNPRSYYDEIKPNSNKLNSAVQKWTELYCLAWRTEVQSVLRGDESRHPQCPLLSSCILSACKWTFVVYPLIYKPWSWPQRVCFQIGSSSDRTKLEDKKSKHSPKGSCTQYLIFSV